MADGFDKWLSKEIDPSIKWSEDGLNGIVRRWTISADATEASVIETECFLARGTPDDEYEDALLIDQGVVDGTPFGEKQIYQRVYQVLPEDNATLVQVGANVITYSETGLKLVEQHFVGRSGHTLSGTVGVTIADDTDPEIEDLYLSGIAFTERGKVVSKVVKRWAEAGILNAEKLFDSDKGLLYVTFISQGAKFTPTSLNTPTYALTDWILDAFQDGPEASIFRDRARNVNGFRIYTVTVMMQLNGNPLDPEEDNEVKNYQDWMDYQKPGSFLMQATGITASAGVPRAIRVDIVEVLSTSPTMDDTYWPYSIKSWVDYNYSYVPSETGVPIYKSGSAKGYLGDGDFASGAGTVFGAEVDAASGSSGSSPTETEFYGLEDAVVKSKNAPDFVTDEGIQWFRRRKVSVDGIIGTYLNAAHATIVAAWTP